MVPTLPPGFNQAAQTQHAIPRNPWLALQNQPLHPLPLVTAVARITTENFQELSELLQVVQRFQGVFFAGVP